MWLLNPTVFEALAAATRANAVPTAEQQLQFEARYNEDFSEEQPRILSLAGDSAEISVQGVLTNRPNYMAQIYGGGNVTYKELIAAIAVAEQDESVKNITFYFDSPGGQVDGLFDAIAAMQLIKKPTRAVANMATSAAYALACQCASIEAANRAARFGSVGIRANFTLRPEDVAITSTDAPNKAPDVATDAGKAIVRAELDAMHALFAESIATGRSVTTQIVNESFGSGATLLADEALSRSMIDSIAATSLKSVQTSTTSAQAGAPKQPAAESDMDLTKLKAEHPAVYAAAVAEGKTQGEAAERDRVTAHLTMGEASGDIKTAMTAIKEGSEMTASLQSTYMAAGMNRKDATDRTEDSADAAAQAAAASGEDGAGDNIHQKVADHFAETYNIGAAQA